MVFWVTLTERVTFYLIFSQSMEYLWHPKGSSEPHLVEVQVYRYPGGWGKKGDHSAGMEMATLACNEIGVLNLSCH